jgi:hypothetical protein
MISLLCLTTIFAFDVSRARLLHIGAAGISLERATIFTAHQSSELQSALRELQWTLAGRESANLTSIQITTSNAVALITAADADLSASCDIASALFRPLLSAEVRFSRTERPLFASEIAIGAIFDTWLRRLALEHVCLQNDCLQPLSAIGVVWFDDVSILFNDHESVIDA